MRSRRTALGGATARGGRSAAAAAASDDAIDLHSSLAAIGLMSELPCAACVTLRSSMAVLAVANELRNNAQLETRRETNAQRNLVAALDKSGCSALTS